jgi:hypothetical protein
LSVALLALMQWGDRHLSETPPRIARRRSDGSPVSVRIVADDGSVVRSDDVEIMPGPGAQPRRASGRSSHAGSRRRPQAVTE